MSIRKGRNEQKEKRMSMYVKKKRKGNVIQENEKAWRKRKQEGKACLF